MTRVSKILVTAPFHHLESSLATRVHNLGGGEPFTRRRVVVISNRLRGHLQVVLARTGGFAGVEILSMIDLAREIAEPERTLAEYIRPHPALAEVLAEEVFECAQGEFVFFKDVTRGYGKSLYAALTDLAEANLSPENLRRLGQKVAGPDGARVRDLALLAESFHSCMRERKCYDRSTLFRVACEKAEAEPPHVPTIFYGFAEMNALQRRLAAAVCREAQSQVLVPALTEASACAYAQPLLDWLQEQGFQREETGPLAPSPLSDLAGALFSDNQVESLAEDALYVVAAPTKGREVWEACREMLRAREDFASGDEICVLMTARNGYTELFEETFHTLDIPCRVQDRNPLSEASAARLFLLMLRLPIEEYPRANLMRFLDEGGFTGSQMFRKLAKRYGFEERIDDSTLTSEWEFFSRSLPYLRGSHTWLAALDDALGRLGKRDEEYPAAHSLAMAMTEAFEFIEKIPQHGPPSLFVAHALAVFAEMTNGLEHEVAAKEVISSLADLDQIITKVSREEFHNLCERFFEKTTLSGGEMDDEHLASLSSILSARGLSFDVVVLSGLGEGLFPPRGTEDPFLPDSMRERLNRAAKEFFPELGIGLPLKKSRESEARFQLWTILQSVRKRLILTATSAKDGMGNEGAFSPSMFLHYMADALGEVRDGAWGLFACSRSRTAAATQDAGAAGENPVHLREYDLARMAEQIRHPQAGRLAYMNDFPGFLRRRKALDERWKTRRRGGGLYGVLTAHDGMLAVSDLRKVIRERVHSPAHPIGVTAVEVFFGCPYRFVNDRLHPRMKKRNEPLPHFAMDGKDRGRLTHRILELFHLWLREENRPLHMLDEVAAQGALRTAIREAMREEADAAESLPLPALPWAVLEDALYRRLRSYVEWMRVDQSGWLPVSVEERFGGRDSDPLRISLQAGELALSGRMDLLERNGAGEYRVVDFKTVGRKNSIPHREKILDGGASLQLHLYTRHLRAQGDALPEDARVSGTYIYVTQEEGVEPRVRSCEEIEGRMADVDALLGYFLDSTREGRFFPTPSNDECRYCDYKLICGPDRAERAARYWKVYAEGVGELRALRERAV